MKINRFTCIAALVAGALLGGAALGFAQDASKEKKHERPAGAPGDRIGMIAKELNLSDEQKAKVKTLMDDQMKKRQELSGLSQEERREKGRALREDTAKGMKAILTPEQFQKWEKMRDQWKGQGKGKGEGKSDAKKKQQ